MNLLCLLSHKCLPKLLKDGSYTYEGQQCERCGKVL